MVHGKLHWPLEKGKVNSVIKYLTTSDIFVWGTTAIATPFVAIYLTTKFGSSTVEYIGLGTAIYYLVRGLTQLPIGAFTDRIKSDHDEIILLVLGCLLIACMYLFLPSVTQVWQYFLLMAVNGLGASLNLNNWRKLFARNLDRNREGFEYGFYETIMSVGTAAFGVLGGIISNINQQAFAITIIVVGILVIIGGLISARIYLVSRRKSANI